MMPPGMDPKKMQQMMRQMGINSEDLDAKSVIIETGDGRLVIDKPQVVRITMQGQVSFQISGDVRKESSITADDVKMVAEQAGVSEEEARSALEGSGGDIAEAIMKLKEGKP
jgi:nascent polypeptide-associated complex subunit alpha